MTAYSNPSEKFIGLCTKCGIAQYGLPHDHKLIGTLGPDEAYQSWTRKKEAEHASESRQ
jgi:hypothetical protein